MITARISNLICLSNLFRFDICNFNCFNGSSPPDLYWPTNRVWHVWRFSLREHILLSKQRIQSFTAGTHPTSKIEFICPLRNRESTKFWGGLGHVRSIFQGRESNSCQQMSQMLCAFFGRWGSETVLQSEICRMDPFWTTWSFFTKRHPRPVPFSWALSKQNIILVEKILMEAHKRGQTPTRQRFQN